MEVFENAVLFVDKPAGMTSNDTIQKIKRRFKIKKIGHAGTLDKFAQGMLIVLLGKATKLSVVLLTKDKSYSAVLHFGKETDTLDPEGKFIRECELPSEEKVRKVVSQYQGIIQQIPPKYSAIHLGGTRAYELVRSGVNFDMPSRTVEIYSNEITNIAFPLVYIDFSVSKGTYIRSLARDIGRDCDSCAYLQSLTRTSIADWTLEKHACMFDDIGRDDDLLNKNENKRGIYSLIQFLLMLEVQGEAVGIKIEKNESFDIRKKLENGIQPLHFLECCKSDTRLYFLWDLEGVLCLWKKIDNHWQLVLHSG